MITRRRFNRKKNLNVKLKKQKVHDVTIQKMNKIPSKSYEVFQYIYLYFGVYAKVILLENAEIYLCLSQRSLVNF